MVSLVGLTATNLVAEVTEKGLVDISSYGKPLCTVFKYVRSIEDVIEVFFALCDRIGVNDYTVIEKPKSEKQLAELYRTLQKEL